MVYKDELWEETWGRSIRKVALSNHSAVPGRALEEPYQDDWFLEHTNLRQTKAVMQRL